MTVHFFTFSDARGGSSRHRAFRVVDELKKRGFSVRIHEPPVLDMSLTRWPRKGLLIFRTIRGLFSIKRGDIVYLQRAIANKYFFAIMVAYLALFRRKMIFDFDDPVYLHSFFKTKTFARMADVVITCTHVQAEWAKQYNENVHVIHIALDLAAYEKFAKDYGASPAEPLVIGWVGTAPEHIHNLEILAGAFRKLIGRTRVPFSFTLIGALGHPQTYELFQGIPGLSVTFIDALDWKNPESVPREIQKFDIGVLPHESEGEWNKGKTALKMLEYMACGVPVVASAFGEMLQVIRDGVDGYLADTEDEWALKLDALLSDKALRERLGRDGQARVREGYCYNAIIPRLAEILEGLGAKRPFD